MQQTSLKKPPDFIHSYGNIYHGYKPRVDYWELVAYAPPHRPFEPGEDCNGCVWMVPGTYHDYAR